MFTHENYKLTNTAFNNFYIGVVEDNQDPDKAGKCRIRVVGLHTSKKKRENAEGIPTDHLPWAIPITPIMGGGVSGVGYFGVPVKGSWVIVGFIGGEHNNPFYFGCISGTPTTEINTQQGFSDPEGIYPKFLNEPDWNRNARNDGKEVLNDIKNANLEEFEPTNIANPTYPYNTVFETPDNGIIVEYDSTPNNERWHIFHKGSKSYMEIQANGDIVHKSTGNKFEITSKGRKIFIKEDNEEKIVGNSSETIEGNLEINITGSTTINSTGIVKITGGGIEIDGGTGTPMGVVTEPCMCPIMGTHVSRSSTVKASL